MHAVILKEGGLVKTILEIVAELCQLLEAILTEGGHVKTFLGNVGLRWCMQAVFKKGGLVKTILEIVVEHCQLLVGHPHGRCACEDNL